MDYVITEKKLLSTLDTSKNVLLIEPNYKRQYKPLGLMKIASYIKTKGGQVTYARGAVPGKFDLICITTLFTTDSKIVIDTIQQCKQNLFLMDVPIIVGGIFASLMPEFIYKKTNVLIFKGYSKILDSYTPDYDIDWHVKEPWDNSMISFTTRGCPNKCGYCMVWRMEPEYYIQENWKASILDNPFEIALISDNNFLSAPIEHIQEVVQVLSKTNKKVIFNNAVDVRLLTEEKAELLSKITYMKNGRPGLRFAFDRMTDDVFYQNACELMIKKLKRKNLSSISLSYVLFNFDDTPQEAYYRVHECWKFKSVPYFMQYRPLDLLTKSKTFIGKHWTKNLVKAFRMYGQTYGFNTGDKTFESWVNNPKSKIKLTSKDWDNWYYKR